MKKLLYFSLFSLYFALFIQGAHSQTLNDLIKRYREAQKSEDYDRMVLILDTVLAKYPNNEPEITYFNRGNTYRHLKEYKKSVSDYTKAIEIKPNYSNAYNNRANSYYDLEEYEKAISDYTKVIEYKPNNPLYYFNRANSYSFIFNYEKAVSDYSKAIDLKPDFADAYYNRGNKYIGMSKYKEAIQDWENAIKYEPKYENELRDKINEAKEHLEKKK